MPRMSTDRYCSPKCAMRGGIEKAARRPKPRTMPEPYRRTRMKAAARDRDMHMCQLRNLIPGDHTSHVNPLNGIEAHHIIYLSAGGPDELFNLISLCKHCHHEIAHKVPAIRGLLLALVNGDDWINDIPVADQSDSVQLKLRSIWADWQDDETGNGITVFQK